jgi:4-diphosphocytidyl-2-C-methyl-D-erythritol kinase
MTVVSDPLRPLAPVVRLAPAKLNLTLAVTGTRADGYHALHSVMMPLALADRLSLAPSPSREDTLHVEGFDPGPKATNLVLRAIASARRAVTPHPAPALAVRLEKRIPVAAGLAGGSSDAAAALDAALEAWAATLGTPVHATIAASLGSDVPFFLAGGPALVEGRGERVTPLVGLRGEPPGILLVTPAVELATPEVFAAWDRGARAELTGAARQASEHFAAELGSGMSSQTLMERAAVLAASNDLLPAAAGLVEGLVPFRRALFRLLERPIGLSGSGPTLWALYPSPRDAELAATHVRNALGTGALTAPGTGPPHVFGTTTPISGTTTPISGHGGPPE